MKINGVIVTMIILMWLKKLLVCSADRFVKQRNTHGREDIFAVSHGGE